MLTGFASLIILMVLTFAVIAFSDLGYIFNTADTINTIKVYKRYVDLISYFDVIFACIFTVMILYYYFSMRYALRNFREK